MAYTGTDEDGGIGYVTKKDVSLREYVAEKIRAIFGRQ